MLVTVGSDHHRFDRLVRWVDAWAATRPVDCLIQHGPAAPPVTAMGVDFLPHEELLRLMAAADAVVVQGGPMSVVESRAAGRLPVVVPRLARLDEVVDDHQVAFSRRWAAEGRLLLAEDEAALGRALDAVLADPAVAAVGPDPRHEAEVARAVANVARVADGILSRTPGSGPPVLMIGGAGRSGSTLLERCLAEVPGVTGLGEVLHLWERGVDQDQLCGCGQPFSRCPFWTEVGRRAFGGWPSLDAAARVADRADVVRGRNLPALVSGGLRPAWRLKRQRLLRHLDALYRGAHEAAGGGLLVDSSKHPAYGYLLRDASVRLRCVLVVRDPRGVAFSWSKAVVRPEVTGAETLMPQYSAGRVALDWLSYRVLMRGLALLGVPLLTVHYEDFVARPREVVAEVLAFCGITASAADLAHVRDEEVSLTAHHTVAGNPMRFRTGAIPVRRDDGWRTGLARRPRLVVEALTLPVRWWDARARRRRTGSGRALRRRPPGPARA
ncbi:sulfotransferase domain-containing protein [Georgenia sp. TF02-10]|uniref:sulfotransferase domain-containing protein n=1 Tax=Georgenia sp. TF02-10 TaxID=2917725 RepID=UPI001FA6E960|nr:sulfotransferase domain-containing protein [Georgenia sp. TF02-10]UNX55578.1 sulfotransferase domain-containing protein [Georgenia sp. TF02-10]